tara:strand:- start:54 stop:626 length:573 start_codon:yes stop_codon:yes gene_type:complete
MAKPISYRKVGKGVSKRCETCKHFIDSTSWCSKWNFIADSEYLCVKYIKELGDVEDESELKKRYRVAAGDKVIERVENYAKPYTPEIKSENYKEGYIFRYFAKQVNNPFSQVVEINEKQYRSAGSTGTGLDGSHYAVVRLQWIISGSLIEVQRSNTKIADYIETRYPKMIGLKDYLYSNLLKFWEGGKKA